MQRLGCLDGLRGALALYVLVSHMAPFAPLPKWLVQPVSHGEAAVDVFFMLSGLVIVRSLQSSEHRPSAFLAARAFRLMPVFLAVFPLALAVQSLPLGFARMPWIGPDSAALKIWSSGWSDRWPAEIAAHLAMIHGLFPDGVLPDAWVSCLGPAWSLSTEWQFYGVMALLATAGQDRARRLPWMFVILSGMAIVWAAAMPAAWQFSRAFLPNKAQYFALGIAAAQLLGVSANGRTVALCRYASVLTCVLVLCAVQGGASKLAAAAVWSACLAAELAPVTVPLRVLAHLLRSRPLRWLGAASYCIYLVNEPVQKALGIGLAAAIPGQPLLFAAFWIPLSIGLPLGVAWLLHLHVEQPGMEWGRNWLRSVRRPDGRPVRI